LTRVLRVFSAGKEGLVVIDNEHVFVLPVVARVRIVIRRVQIAEVNQAVFWQRPRRLHLGPRVNAIEELGERDGVVAGGDSIFLVRT
jgi:hypothetical protein